MFFDFFWFVFFLATTKMVVKKKKKNESEVRNVSRFRIFSSTALGDPPRLFTEWMESLAVKGAWSVILFYYFTFLITLFVCLLFFFRSVRLCHTSDTYSPGSVHIQKKNCHNCRCTCTFSVDGEPL